MRRLQVLSAVFVFLLLSRPSVAAAPSENPLALGKAQSLAHPLLHLDLAKPLRLEPEWTVPGRITLSSAVADFDADGFDDLVVGFHDLAGGSISWAHSQGAKGGEPTRFSKIPRAGTARLPGSPDFLVTGDFDADDDVDVVAASRGGRELHFLAGNGRGSFEIGAKILLSGPLTLLAGGDVDRADGLTDLLVGVTLPDREQLLLFESPRGAFFATPIAIPLPDRAVAVATGQFDAHYAKDLAIAAGDRLMFVYGRDRKLQIEDSRGRKAPPPVVEILALPAPVQSLGAGDFLGDHRTELALLLVDGSVYFRKHDETGKGNIAASELQIDSEPDGQIVRARLSGRHHDDLLVFRPHLRRLDAYDAEARLLLDSIVFENEPRGVHPVRLNEDALTDLVLVSAGVTSPAAFITAPLATFTVNSTADTNDGTCNAAHCTLREAILAANDTTALDTINFAIGSGTPAIEVGSSGLGALPTITNPLDIAGDTGGATRVSLNGTSAGAAADGLRITASSCSLRGLAIGLFSEDGIEISGGGSGFYDNNYIGADATGAGWAGNGGDGIYVGDSANNFIGISGGGLQVIGANGGDGIELAGSASTNNNVQLSHIGIDEAGTWALDNSGNGILINGAPGNIIGAAAPNRVVISGNGGHGIEISGAGADGNTILANYIGTDATGSVDTGNFFSGVLVTGGIGTTIGGTSAGSRNVISGNNQFGIETYLSPASTMTTFVATDVPKPIPDASFTSSAVTVADSTVGVVFVQVTFSITHPLDADLDIYLVAPSGERIELSTDNGLVGDNYTNTIFDDGASAPITSGVAPFTGSFRPEGRLAALIGIVAAGAWTLEVGDDTSGATGTLTGWTLTLWTIPSSDLSILGNYIGTDAAGTADLGNTFCGAWIEGFADSVGGTSSGARNVISGNDCGLVLSSAGGVIQGNFVGTDADGTAALPNAGWGLGVYTEGVLIGGTTAGAGNLISGNDYFGIELIGGSDHLVQGNYLGADVTGTLSLGNLTGIGVSGAGYSMIGGTAAGAGNLISGNTSNGIEIGSYAPSGNVVQGNLIGTDASGTLPLGNSRNGIEVFSDASSTIIGGTTAGARNVISANGIGVEIAGRDTLVQGNFIGTDVTGVTDLGNRYSGVFVTAAYNTIGGTVSGAENVISGNGTDGVKIVAQAINTQTLTSADVPKPVPDLGSASSVLAVPDLGTVTDVNVTLTIYHTFDGDLDIFLRAPTGALVELSTDNGASGDHYINTNFDDEAALAITAGFPPFSSSFRPEGSLAALDGISAYGTWTLEVTDDASTSIGDLDSWSLTLGTIAVNTVIVQQNKIGTDAAGTGALGNDGTGVLIGNGSGNNLIGAEAGTGGNTIAFNGGEGVGVDFGGGNRIRRNSIFSNFNLGIDLEGGGVTANDLGDGDSGANALQNFPVITSTSFDGTNSVVSAAINSTPNTNFTIDFFGSSTADESGSGEGQVFLGTTFVTTDAGGNVSFGGGYAGSYPFVSATATSPAGDTSEFSLAFSNPKEASPAGDLIALKGAGTVVNLSYAPACGATDHAVYRGTSPISGSLSWTASTCNLGTSGSASPAVPTPASGQFSYFVVVGYTANSEGSYGQNSAAAEEPEAVGIGACDLLQNLSGSCP